MVEHFNGRCIEIIAEHIICVSKNINKKLTIPEEKIVKLNDFTTSCTITIQIG